MEQSGSAARWVEDVLLPALKENYTLRRGHNLCWYLSPRTGLARVYGLIWDREISSWRLNSITGIETEREHLESEVKKLYEQT